jgi:hypothetical protein
VWFVAICIALCGGTAPAVDALWQGEPHGKLIAP